MGELMESILGEMRPKCALAARCERDERVRVLIGDPRYTAACFCALMASGGTEKMLVLLRGGD